MSFEVYCSVSTPKLWPSSSAGCLCAVNTHTHTPSAAFALLICQTLRPSRKARPGLTATQKRWRRDRRALSQLITTDHVLLGFSFSGRFFALLEEVVLIPPFCCSRRSTRGCRSLVDPRHPHCPQPIFPIYLTASHRLSCSFPGVSLRCLCVVPASVGLFISTEKPFGPQPDCLPLSATRLAAVSLSAGRWQQRAD